MSTRNVLLSIALFVLAMAPGVALAQEGLPDPQALAGQSLRGYTHVFVAYVIAWALIAGWVVSIARRLARLEKALKDG